MPSQAEIEQHRADVQELSALAVAEVAALVILLSGEDDDPESALVEAVPPVLERFMEASALLAVDWYRGLARETPVAPERRPGAPEPIVGPTDRISLLDAQSYRPEPAPVPPREQLEASVRWAVHQPAPAPETVEDDDLPRDVERDEPEREDLAEDDRDIPEQEDEQFADLDEPDELDTPVDEDEGPRRARVIPAEATEQQAQVISRLAGVSQRYVASAARNTLTHNASQEGVRWARHAQADACTFCRMLATRGPDYLTRESASVVGASGRIRGSRKAGEAYHDDCSCEPVPVRAGDAYEPPDYVSDWIEQYYLAVDQVGNAWNTNAILAHMRALEVEAGGSRH